MNSRLTLKGLGVADGTYEFDFAELVSIGGTGALNLREQQRIKIMTGYRGLEIREAAAVLDPSMMVALAAIILTRNGQTVNEQRLWDARPFYTDGADVADLEPHRIALHFHLDNEDPAAVDEEQQEVEGDSPPA